MSNTKVHIEYCGSWGYEPRANELREAILARAQDVEVTMEVGRPSSFEIKLNDKLLFSKYETTGKTAMKILIDKSMF